MRPEVDPIDIQWTKWQYGILRKMGTVWADEGRIKVIVVDRNTSIAQVVQECDFLQRGDIIVPFTERPAPPMKSEDNFDRFAPPSGKAKAMLIVGKKFQQELGTNDIAYVNLGRDQGVRVGDYFRVFRYTGTEHETAFQTSADRVRCRRLRRDPRSDLEKLLRNGIGTTRLERFSAREWSYEPGRTPRQCC